MSTVHDARLVPVAGAAWAIALWATGPGGPAAWLLWLAGAVGLGLAWAALRTGSPLASVVALSAWAGLAVVVVVGAQNARDTEQGEALRAAGGTEAWITVTGQPSPMSAWGGAPRHRAPATVTAWRPHCREPPECRPWTAADAPVVVSLETAPSRGEELLIAARWDVADRAPATAVAWDADVVGSAPPSALVQWRAQFSRATGALGDESRGLVRGMVVGDTSSMPPSQVRDMRIAGLAHLTAVSGAHFAILIMTTGAVLAACRAPRLVRAGAVLAVAVTFAALVGPEASVLRALGMALAVALALAWGRPARGLAALATSVVVLLVVEPALSRSLGFAMSVLAVAAIVLWAPRIAAALGAVVTPGLARIASIPIAAQTAVTPVLVVIDPHVGSYAVIANLAAGVAVLPTMLAGAVTLVLSAVSVPAAQVAAQVAGVAASGIAAVARAVAAAPGSWLPWPAGAIGVGTAIAIALLLIVAVLRGSLSRRVIALTATGALFVIATTSARVEHGPVMEGWDVALCDVGQGDMMLMRAGPSAAVVIDTGPPDGGAAACLRRHGVDEVPLLVLTHPHQDHDGAVVSVLASARVERAWISAAGADGPAARALGEVGVPVEVPARGHTVQAGAVALTAVSEGHTSEQIDGNDASVVVHAQAGQTSVLALGDLETAGQRDLLRLLPQGVEVDVVKVAHHGSADQWPALIERIDADVAVVSAGRDNRHGHPTATAIELYGTTTEAVLRTDLCGDVHVGTLDGLLAWSRCPTDVAR